MKKKILFALLFPFVTSLFAVTPSTWSFTAGLSTAIPFYGREDTKHLVNQIENPNRIILGTFFNVNLNSTKYVTFFTGGELLTDFCWNSDVNSSFFHTNIPLGVKIFPNLGGFDFGLAYTLGFCGYTAKYGDGSKHANTTPWGNGFKLLCEYDFSRVAKSKNYPTLGVSWNYMPRGQSSKDNFITFYLGLNF